MTITTFIDYQFFYFLVKWVFDMFLVGFDKMLNLTRSDLDDLIPQLETFISIL